MLGFKTSGSFDNIDKFLKRMSSNEIWSTLDHYGRKGADALSSATPVDTGRAADAWRYKVSHKNDVHTLSFYNNDVENGQPIVILIQYGHGTGTGGYVQGRNFINPAIRPIFDQLLEDIWKQVIA